MDEKSFHKVAENYCRTGRSKLLLQWLASLGVPAEERQRFLIETVLRVADEPLEQPGERMNLTDKLKACRTDKAVRRCLIDALMHHSSLLSEAITAVSNHSRLSFAKREQLVKDLISLEVKKSIEPSKWRKQVRQALGWQSRNRQAVPQTVQSTT